MLTVNQGEDGHIEKSAGGRGEDWFCIIEVEVKDKWINKKNNTSTTDNRNDQNRLLNY